MGPGQPNRVDSTRLAIQRAEKTLELEFKVLRGEPTELEKAYFQGETAWLEQQRTTLTPEMTFEDYKKRELAKCVAASDAFFPFEDGPTALAEFGIKQFIQPGGSTRDAQTIEVMNRYGAAMIFTGTRHFLH